MINATLNLLKLCENNKYDIMYYIQYSKLF